MAHIINELNEKHQMMKQSIAASIINTQVQSPQFDLTNHVHLKIRKLLADVYARHARALERELPLDAAQYRGMGKGIERVVIHVLCAPALGYLCASLNCALNDQLSLQLFKEFV